MADAYKGLTIKFGADTSDLSKAMREVSKGANDAQRELRQVQGALKLDPSNLTLLEQKQRRASEAAEALREKIRTINTALASGEVERGSLAWDRLQRELVNATSRLSQCERAAEEAGRAMGSVRDGSAQAAQRLRETAQAAQQASEGYARQAESLRGVSEAAGRVGDTLTMAVTAPLVAAGAASVSTAATFESAMSGVAGALGQPADSMGELSELALQMGADTIFSANESAAAMQELAKGGLTEADIKAGALKASMDLAAAGGLDLATAANTIVQSMGAFGLSADDTARAANALAGSANASSADVSDLTQGLSQCSAAASNAGWDIESTTAVLGMFADAGIQGSDAGTSLKTMLQRLSAPTGEAATMMEQLGIETRDADGNMLSASQVADQLQGALGSVDSATRDMALSTIFGSDAMRAATVFMNQGAEGLSKYEQATRDTQSASRMAEAQMGDTARAIEEMKGAIETAAIEVGGALAPAVTEVAKTVGQLAEGFSELDDATQANIVKAAALAAAMGPAAKALQGVTGAASGVYGALSKLKAVQAAGQLTGIGAAARTMAGGFLSAAAPIAAVTAALGIAVASGAKVAQMAADNAEAAREWAERNENLRVAAEGVSGALASVDPTKLSEAAGDADSASGALDGAAESASDFAARMSEAAEASNQGLEDAASRIQESAERLAKVDVSNAQLQGYVDTMRELGGQGELTDAQMVELEAAVRRFNEVTGSSVTIVDEQTGALSQTADAIQGVADAYMAQAKAQAYQQELTGLYEQQIEQARELEKATQDVAEAQVRLWESQRGAGFDDMLSQLGLTREQLVALTAADRDFASQMVNATKPAADAYTGSLQQQKGATDEAIGALANAEAAQAGYQAQLDGTTSDIASMEGALSDYSKAAEEAADATDGAAGSVGGLGDAASGAVAGVRGSVPAVEDLTGALESSEEKAADAGAAIEEAFAQVAASGGDLATLTETVNAALKEAGVITDDLTEAQVRLGFESGATGDQMVTLASNTQTATDAQKEQEEAAKKAAEELEKSVESMVELAAQTPGLQEVVEASGTTLRQLALDLEEFGPGVEGFKAAWDGLSDVSNPFDAYAYDWETFNAQALLDGLNTNTQVVSDWAEGIQELWANATTEQDRQFVQYLQDMGVDSATIMQNWIDGVGPSYEEVRDAYIENQRELEETVLGNAQAGMEAGRQAGEAIPQGTAEGIEDGASQVTDSSQVLGEAAYQALTTMPDEFEARGKVAGWSLGEGLGSTDLSGAATSLTSSLGLALASLPDMMRTHGQDSASAFGEGLGSADAAQGAALSLSQAVASALSDVPGAMGTVGETSALSFAEGIGAGADDVTGAAASLSSAAASALANFEAGMGSTGELGGQALADGVSGKSGEVSSAAGSLMTAAGQALGGFPSAMRSQGEYGGSQFADGVQYHMGSAYSAAQSLAGAAASGLSGYAGWAFSSGAELGGNFASGVRSQAGAVASAASAVAQAASDRLHFTEPKIGPLVGINDSGEELAENYAASMLRGRGAIEAAARRLADSASFTSLVDVQARADATRAALAAPVAAMGRASRPRVVTRSVTGDTNTSNVTINIDGESFAGTAVEGRVLALLGDLRALGRM